MRLTKYLKEQIYKSILSGLPAQIDYKQQAQDIVWKDSHNQLPKPLQDAIASDADVKSYLNVESNSIADFGCMYLRSYKHYVMTKDAAENVRLLHKKIEDQSDKYRQIKNNLWALIDKCTTVENFAKSYPEFAGYIPTDEKTITNLPAVNLIAEMSNLGWKQK